jgi:hypothetical protein
VAGRPGRTQRIAFDETPLNAARPDIDARIGWLLAMSRLHHPDSDVRDGRRFAESLAEAGVKVSRSLVSRWEAGEIPISYEGMSAYETVLDLQVGQISSISGYIKASIPSVSARVVRPRLDPTSPGFADRLDELIEQAEAGGSWARDWEELGWHLAAAPMVHLRRGTWETLAQHLVNRLPRSVKVAYRQLSTAAMNMATVERAQEFLVEAVRTYISDPAAQVVTTPTGLLDRLPTRTSARLVLDIIDKPRDSLIYTMGVWVCAQKLVRGDFTDEERNELGMLVLREWRRDPLRASRDLAEVIGALPEGLRSTLVQASERAGRRKLGYVVEHGEELVASKAKVFGEEVATRARAAVDPDPPYDEDRMLARLIREGLFHRDSERRHLASLLIASSPFGSAVTEQLLTRLAEPQPDWIRGRIATLARYLSSEEHRMRFLDFLDDPVEDVAVPAAHALGHMRLNTLSDHALRSLLHDQWTICERARMYALGMSGSPGLAALVKSPAAPQWQKDAAGWWLAHGSAVRR